MNNSSMGIATIFNFGEMSLLPDQCSVIAEVKGGRGCMYDKNNIASKTDFVVDDTGGLDFEQYARDLAPVKVPIKDASSSLPSCITFLHQYTPTQYTDYITYLHTQNCYIRFLTDNPRTIHFVYFPKSSNPKTIAIFIRNFYNNIVAADTNTIYRLSIRLYDEEQKNKILKHIDGRYWYILDKIHFFRLNCIDILNII